MARVAFVTRVIDEAGNALGGSPTEVRIWDDFGATAATTVTDDTGGGTTITQPLIPNAGTQTTLTVTTGTGDTTLTVASTAGFSVGQLIPIYDGTATRYRFIRSILSGPPRLTIEAAIGVVFSNTNTAVGNPDMLGVVAGYVSDSTFHYVQTKDVGSTRVMPPTLIPTFIGISSVGVGEEGTTVGTRALINFVGPSVTAVDNPGATRVDVTLTGLEADGTITTPSIGFSADPDTGFFRVTTNTFSAVAGGKEVMRFSTLGTDVNYVNARSSGSGGSVALLSAGTDTDINITIAPKGAGVVNFSGGSSVALGGGSAPTFGTIGGSGPATAAQNSWMKCLIAGTVSYIPVWR